MLTHSGATTMVSMRFPFAFSQPPANSSTRRFISPFTAGYTIAAATIATGAAVVAANQNGKFGKKAFSFILDSVAHSRSSPLWASASLSDSSSSSPSVIESKTGASFPAIINDSQRLLGVGLRRKSLFGLKNIDVYAFGVYADDSDVKECLDEKYEKLSAKEDLSKGLLEADISMTVRLQIVYGRLSIRSVRSAFEESVGSRLQKFGGPGNKELLQSFTSLFKDEYKIPRGSVIELCREKGHNLRTKIDGTEVGCVQSQLLCKSVLDLYIGDDPFDHKAKEDVTNQLATFLEK